MSWLKFAAEEAGPHVSLKAEELFKVSGLSITNSMLYGLIISVLITITLTVIARKSTIKPQRGAVQLLEGAMEFLIGATAPILGSRAKAEKYAPLFGTFFVFIVFNNLSGLLPVVGEGLTFNHTPLFRPFTADINGTIALSVVAILLVQVLSIRESGILGHLKHYFTDKPLNPINLFIGILEVFGEFTRIASLSLRLFLNTAVGEILIAVFAFIGGYGSSFTLLPIVVFEVLVALIQAYVFTILSATYLGLATAHAHDEHESHESSDHTPATLSPSEAGA